MRLFVAVDVDQDTRNYVRHVRESLQERFAALRTPPRVTWVADDMAHVTVRFIGEVPAETGASIMAALRGPIPLAPFEVEWKGTGTFPIANRPRVVWIGASAGADRIAALAAIVNARVEPVVGPGESRPFKAHLTVGRVKDPGRGVDWAAALADVGPVETRHIVDRVTLYQSRTSPKGATYTRLSETSLRV